MSVREWWRLRKLQRASNTHDWRGMDGVFGDTCRRCNVMFEFFLLTGKPCLSNSPTKETER